jgi:antitoxin component of MazEF toxin-antitoxin module
MSKYTATIIKTGNSYALRVPKAYIEDGSLVLGQKVELPEPALVAAAYDPEAVRRAIRQLREARAYASIADPVAWQREIRQDRSLPSRDS